MNNDSAKEAVSTRMRFAVIVAVGTSAGGIVKLLRRILADHPDIERLGVLHVDSDGTMAFAHLPVPLMPGNGRDGWGPNTFVHIPPPPADVARSIRSGERLGFDHVPPAVFDTVNGDGVGVGGLVPLGNAAGILHEPRLRGAIRRVINRITAHRSELNQENDEPLVVFEVAVSLGGTWGALEEVREVIVSEAHTIGTPVSFQRTVLFPGQHPTRDTDASMANAAAWLREYTARASGRYLRCRRSKNGDVPVLDPVHADATWIVSDMNAAPGMSATLPTTSALFSVVAYWHWLLLTTPLGARLDQALVDFRDDALGVDRRGERRVGRSYGLSFITLNHERIERYAASRLVRTSVSSLLSSVDPAEVEEAARAFNRANRLHEGSGFTDLSSAIRKTDHSGRPVDQIARFRNLLDDNLDGREGIMLLRDAPAIIDATVMQTANVADHFRAIREAKIRQFEAALDDRIARWLWDPDRGAAFVQAWLAEQQRYFDRMVDLAAEDRRAHGERIEQLQAAVQRLEEEAVPRFLAMGIARRWFNRRHIHELGDRYLRNRRSLEVARREDEARTEAIAALRAMVEALGSRHAAVTGLIQELVTTREAAAAEENRIRQWDGTHVNPNGFQLDSDLEDYYGRVVRRGEDAAGDDGDEDAETRAALDLLTELRARGDLVALATEPGRIGSELDALARDRISPRVRALHVEDELFRRHAPGSASLAAFLRERDREAFERSTFRGTTEHDNPVHILRFVVADRRRGSELIDALNHAAYTRGQAHGNAEYELIPAPHSDRISIVQMRLSFPPSQVGLHGACAAVYEESSGPLEFERNHTELVGRFLPRPGQRATVLDAQVALLKAYALSGVSLGGRPAPLELRKGGPHVLALRRWQGESEPLEKDITSDRHVLRKYDLRVELATRFYCTWRLHGSDLLWERIRRLQATGFLSGTADALAYDRPLEIGDEPEAVEDPLAVEVAGMISNDAVTAVVDELQWYARNTSPLACYWSRSAR